MAMLKRKETKRGLVSKRILILCEGKTEKLYLDGIKNSLPKSNQRDIQTVVIQAKRSDPTIAFKEFLDLQREARNEKQPFEKCWMVFDDDNRVLKDLF